MDSSGLMAICHGPDVTQGALGEDRNIYSFTATKISYVTRSCWNQVIFHLAEAETHAVQMRVCALSSSVAVLTASRSTGVSNLF